MKILRLFLSAILISIILSACGSEENFTNHIKNGEYQKAISDYVKYIQGSAENESEAIYFMEEYLAENLREFSDGEIDIDEMEKVYACLKKIDGDLHLITDDLELNEFMTESLNGFANTDISVTNMNSIIIFVADVNVHFDYENYLSGVIDGLINGGFSEDGTKCILDFFEDINEEIAVSPEALSKSRTTFEEIRSSRATYENAVSEYSSGNYEISRELFNTIDKSDTWAYEKAQRYMSLVKLQLQIKDAELELKTIIESGQYSQEYIETKEEIIASMKKICKNNKDMIMLEGAIDYWAKSTQSKLE